MGVGTEIRRVREAKGWSQTKLAAGADMGVSGISQIETGARNPSVMTLAKIAGALGVEVADLFPKGQVPLPDFEGERRDIFHEDAICTMVLAAARRQADQDAQAANRTLASERPQSYFKRHENGVAVRLAELSRGELADSLVELANRYIRLENRMNRWTESTPAALLVAAFNAKQLPEPEYVDLLKEMGFSQEQIEAWQRQEERDEPYISREARELENMSAKDFLEELIASPGSRMLREYYREAATEPRTARSESA